MNHKRISRRSVLVTGGSAVAASGLTGAGMEASRGGDAKFRYCLNTSTIRGQQLGIVKEFEVAAKAGFTSVEPWTRSIQEYATAGGSLRDLAKRARDLGLTVESAVGFSRWIVDDETERAKAFEQIKVEMDFLAQIGGQRIAAPPAGANREPGLDLNRAAARYRALLELGERMGIVPQLELWGSSANLSRLGEVAHVAIECGHPKACLVLDVFHLYKGGSDFNGLKLLDGTILQVFHVNDYPADPPRETIRDSDRIMPGDGIAPLRQILGDLSAKKSEIVLSLELFSKVYWEMDPLEAAKTGLARMRGAVAAATAA